MWVTVSSIETKIFVTIHETKPFFMLNLAYLRYSKITYFGFLVTYFATFGYIKMSYFGMKKYIFYLSLSISQTYNWSMSSGI